MAATTKTQSVLIRLYEAETIVVGPTTGWETLANSGDVFAGYVSPFFGDWGTNIPSDPTGEMEVSVWKVTQNATFREMFSSLGDPQKLCLTQGQIRMFVLEHRDKLHPKEWATFFLFRVEKDIFVVFVDGRGRGLEADVYRFGYSHVWGADYRSRVVVPQLD